MPEIIEVDLCIYGGTSGGVIAACAAAREGRSVVLIEPGRHLGGMTTGGLGFTDIKGTDSIGGMSRAFYERVGAHYRALGTPAEEHHQGEGWTHEPRVATAIIESMIQESGASVVRNHRLSQVEKSGARLVSIRLDLAPTDALNAPVALAEQKDALEVRARGWIDASYEGDLMAGAGVSHTTRREARAQYDEPLAGVIYGAHQDWNGRQTSNGDLEDGRMDVDAYRVPGDLASGLLPGLESDHPAPRGQASAALQAYNFRLCLTDVAANRVAIEAPDNYDATNYELLGRHLQARRAAGYEPPNFDFHQAPWGVVKLSRLPGGKFDHNNGGAVFSSDFVGANAGFSDANWELRGKIWHAHIDYQRGLWHFLREDARVPDEVKQMARDVGLCADEFVDTRGWSPQLYVRESRRMIGAHVMTQNDIAARRTFPDAVGMGSYSLDSHLCRRFESNGTIYNEGAFLIRIPGAYQIPYRALTPRENECENLLVLFCLSSTHAAYSSLRMEPVLMILGESAALAASAAIIENCSVQSIDGAKFQTRLREAGQKLQL